MDQLIQMPDRATDESSIARLIGQLKDDGLRLAEAEIALAKQQIKSRMLGYVFGGALLLVALFSVLVAVFILAQGGIAFLLLHVSHPLYAYLSVSAVLILLSAACGFAAFKAFTRRQRPVGVFAEFLAGGVKSK